MTDPKRKPGRPYAGGPTPVCTVRLPAELHAVLRELHRSGRLIAWLRQWQSRIKDEQ